MIGIPKLILLRLVVYLLVFALPAIFAPGKLMKFFTNLIKNEELMRICGFFAMILALFFFMVHISFDGTWYMVFTIGGLVALLKGIRLIRFPKSGNRATELLFGHKKVTTVITGIFVFLASMFLLRVAVAKI